MHSAPASQRTRLFGSGASVVRREREGVCKSGVIFVSAVFFLFLCCGAAHAATITATSCSQAAVTTAIASASNGDTVLVPGPCSASWSSLTVPGTKGITIACSKPTCSISGATALIINQSVLASARVTGFTFNTVGGSSNPTILTFGDGTTKMARIDNNIFTNTSSGTWIETDSGTVGYGSVLIDHNSLSAAGSAEMIHVVAYGPDTGQTIGWANDVVPGSANMVFIEDNTSNSTDFTVINNLVQSYYGARTVIRHNTINFGQIDQHGTAGLPWSRWWEIYGNTFDGQNHNPSDWIELRGGTGVVWGNTFKNGNTDIGLQDEVCGKYPDPMQFGRGMNQSASPAYFWSNGPSGNFFIQVEQCSANVQLNRDYFVSSSQPATLTRCQSAADVLAGCPVSYNYTPFTYPFPLDANGLPNPNGTAPPTNLGAAPH
jgi:hypothetical protein